MGKSIKCILILHTKVKEINMGNFESISKAKRYVSECWDGPYTIIPLKKINNE